MQEIKKAVPAIIDMIAMHAATDIAALFDVEMLGGSVQRTAAIQCRVVQALSECESPAPSQPILSAVVAQPHWIDCPQSALGGKTAREGYAANPEYASAAAPVTWKTLADKAVAVLGRHIEPGGISDKDALIELYGIFDGADYRAALASSPAAPTEQTDLSKRLRESAKLRTALYAQTPEFNRMLTDAADALDRAAAPTESIPFAWAYRTIGTGEWRATMDPHWATCIEGMESKPLFDRAMTDAEDAARYRWLRKDWCRKDVLNRFVPRHPVPQRDGGVMWCGCTREADYDSAVDASMSADAQSKGDA